MVLLATLFEDAQSVEGGGAVLLQTLALGTKIADESMGDHGALCENK